MADRADDLKAAQLATAQAINRHSMMLLGLWLLSLVLLGFPDVYFLKTAATVSIPVVGATSFKLVLVVLPLLMLAVRVHLGVYVRHERAVEERMATTGVAPVWTASYKDYPLMRIMRSFVLYLSVPTAFAAMTYKGMVYVDMGLALLAGTLLIAGVHLVSLLRDAIYLSSIEKAAVALVVVIAVAGSADEIGEFRRPFQLDLADLKRADLRGEDLRQARFYRADLSGAALAESKLAGAYMADAVLSGADFWEATLTKADLRWANLTGANFSGADLTGADFRDADFSNATMIGASLIGANLTDANPTQSQLLWACGNDDTRLSGNLIILTCD